MTYNNDNQPLNIAKRGDWHITFSNQTMGQATNKSNAGTILQYATTQTTLTGLLASKALSPRALEEQQIVIVFT